MHVENAEKILQEEIAEFFQKRQTHEALNMDEDEWGNPLKDEFGNPLDEQGNPMEVDSNGVPKASEDEVEQKIDDIIRDVIYTTSRTQENLDLVFELARDREHFEELWKVSQQKTFCSGFYDFDDVINSLAIEIMRKLCWDIVLDDYADQVEFR